jgi:general secretion pathway protein D
MKRQCALIILALAVLLSLAPGPLLSAKPADNSTSSQATSTPALPAPLPAKPPEKVTLDVRGLDVDNLLQFYSRTFGLTVIKDPNLAGPVTIMCPQPVTQQEALDILNSVLEVRGFTSLVRGSVLKIVPLAKAVQSNVGVAVGPQVGQEGDQVITQMVPLKTADAAQLQAELSPLVSAGASIIANSASNTLTITDYASNVSRLLRIVDQLDSQQAAETRVFPLIYAQASDVAQVITQVFFGQPRLPIRPGTIPPDWQRRLVGVVAATSGGRSPLIGAPAGQVVADTRTNSVIVTASKDRIQTIAQVIESLDKPVEYQGTLTVLHLERANAQEVAGTLSQAVGGRAGGTTRAATGASTRRTTQPSRTTPSTRSSSQSTPRPVGQNPDAGPSRLGQAPADPAAQTATEGSSPGLEIAQLPQGAGRSTQSTVGRGAEGQIVNVIEAAGNVSVVAEPNTNSLIINAPPEYVDLLTDLIRELDQAPPQVLIEAIIAEVSLNGERKLGFEWAWTENRHLGQENAVGTLGTDFGLDSENLGLRYAVTSSGLNTLLHALATDSKVTILSTPRIFTSNNREAEINISTQTPYVSTVRTTDLTQTFAVEYLDVGVVLRVTPQIAPDGTVTMQVTQEANELLGYEQFGTNVKAPTVARRSAQATIRVADGQTIMLGGIIRDNASRSVSKVPVLGDLPLLGNLFRRSTVTKEKTELIVFLTPKVVRTSAEATALTESQKKDTAVRLPALPVEKSPAPSKPSK